jgi:N-acyl-D-amino-acid deacylase
LDLEALWGKLRKSGFPLNQAMMIGHSWALREAVGIGDTYAPPTSRQIEEMVALLEKGFSQGAIGLSFGLEYAPGSSSTEILALAHVAAKLTS